jgi:hypothetical protein
MSDHPRIESYGTSVLRIAFDKLIDATSAGYNFGMYHLYYSKCVGGDGKHVFPAWMPPSTIHADQNDEYMILQGEALPASKKYLVFYLMQYDTLGADYCSHPNNYFPQRLYLRFDL